jgi:hypothetical protein
MLNQALVGLPVVVWSLLAAPINLQTMRSEEDVPTATLAGNSYPLLCFYPMTI